MPDLSGRALDAQLVVDSVAARDVQAYSSFASGAVGVSVDCLCDRELDALVAQCLFGLEVQRRPDRTTGELDIFYDATPRAFSPQLVRVPAYCRCVSASIEVENKLQDWGWHRHSPPPGWRPSPTHVVLVVLEHRDKRRVQAMGPFETALCRAALKAVQRA